MRKISANFLFVLVVLLLTGLFLLVQARAENVAPELVAMEDQKDSNPATQPQVWIPAQYQPTEADLQAASLTNTTTLYFTPQDENTSVTILFLYNTGNVNATVTLQTFSLNGSQFIDTSVNVPPAHLVRIASDTVSTISSSWANAILVNFTTSSTYAKLTLPPGVKVETYVAWNGDAPYDPLVAVPMLPLRLSTDLATLFLPNVTRN